jgi:hypothetical protein
MDAYLIVGLPLVAIGAMGIVGTTLLLRKCRRKLQREEFWKQLDVTYTQLNKLERRHRKVLEQVQHVPQGDEIAKTLRKIDVPLFKSEFDGIMKAFTSHTHTIPDLALDLNRLQNDIRTGENVIYNAGPRIEKLTTQKV